MSEETTSVGQRISSLIDELGIGKAHIASGLWGSTEAFALARERPGSISSITFLLPPNVLDEEAVAPHAEHLVCIVGLPLSPPGRQSLDTIRRWRGPTIVDLPSTYSTAAWSDLVADHTDLIIQTLSRQAVKREAIPPIPAHEGVLHDIRYRITGSGPPLLLFPIGLAPTQWTAAIPRLSERFTTIRLGGPLLGAVPNLEERATKGTYIQGVRSMFDLLGIRRTDRVLEVGTGSGVLARDLASSPEAPTTIVAVDLSEYLLDEARFMARRAGATTIDFQEGDAESLPFEDESFDVAFSVTVFEECDAARAISELHRVLKPEGRGGVIIRSRDLPRHWNLDVPEGVRRKINAPFPEVVAPSGVIDATLYDLFGKYFREVTPNPFWRSMAEVPPVTVSQTTALLEPAEVVVFEQALAVGKAAGTVFAATPFHCAVGTKL